MACEDSLNNIGDLTLLIGISTYTSEATAASSRTEDFKVVAIRPDDEDEGESDVSQNAESGNFCVQKIQSRVAHPMKIFAFSSCQDE